MTKSSIKTIIWAGTALIYVVPFVRWGSGINWDISNITTLTLFPLFGLWAYLQMWMHYFVGAIKRRHPDKYNYQPWFDRSSYAVLVLILLHPALLAFYGFTNNFSATDYVGSANYISVLFAYVALAGFLLYDLAKAFKGSVFWESKKGLIKAVSIVSMVVIFLHSIKLGQHLQSGWFLTVWFALFAAFVFLAIDSYTYKSKDLSKS